MGGGSSGCGFGSARVPISHTFHCTEADLAGQHSLPTLAHFHTFRLIRPDKLVHAMQLFVMEQMGRKFIEPPPFDLDRQGTGRWGGGGAQLHTGVRRYIPLWWGEGQRRNKSPV